MYYDLKRKVYIEEKENKILAYLYNSTIGRCILKIATTKLIAKIYAIYMNSFFSKIKIKKFIKKNNINMEEYKDKNYSSFNDFFIREIKEDKRKIEDGIIAVCDSKLTIYKIDEKSNFNIKNRIYTIEELIDENKEYKYALVFRLCVDDYHHYIYPDDGKIIKSKHINGRLHTVQPIAFNNYKVFHENSREITFLNCKNLGEICYIEVGALMIGKIVNLQRKQFQKGQEKGHFEFGGSTVVILINKEIEFNKKILENSKRNIETVVKMGQCIGIY